MDLSIIVVSWNTRELLARCLDSIYSYPPASEYEVWVVDNSSADASADMVRTRFPKVRLIENRENVGFACANNQAIRESSGRYVLLLNSDTLVQPSALSLMVAFMETHPDCGILGANILNPDGTRQYCFARFPTLFSEIALSLGLDTHFPFSLWLSPHLDIDGDSIETDWVGGAALMARRQALDRIGLLDESYFMYSEEVDLAYRVRLAGWKTFVLHGARVVHLGQQSSRRVPAAMKAQLFRSKVLYFRKHHSRAAALILETVIRTSILVKSCTYRLEGRKALASLWSETWDYFIAKGSVFSTRQEQVSR